MKPEGYIILTAQFHKEGLYWVGVCNELGTSAFSITLNGAVKKLREGVLANINCLEEVGERERFFKENNIAYHKISPKNIQIPVPLNANTYIRTYVEPLPSPNPC